MAGKNNEIFSDIIIFSIPKFTPLIIPSPQEELNGIALEKEEVQHNMSNANTWWKIILKP